MSNPMFNIHQEDHTFTKPSDNVEALPFEYFNPGIL